MKHKVLFQAFSVERADRRVVAHLLRYEPEAQVVSGVSGETAGVGTSEDEQKTTAMVD